MTAGDGGATEESNPPVIQVISPSATAQDIAVVVAVLAAAGGDAQPPAPIASQWVGRAPHSWRTSDAPH